MLMYNEIKIVSLLILLHAHGLGKIGIKKLIEEFGSAEKIIAIGWDPKKRTLFGKWVVGDWEADLEEAHSQNIQLVTYQDAIYPKNLLDIHNFPLLLYVK